MFYKYAMTANSLLTIFSLPKQSSGKAIALPPASALASALARC